MVAWGDGLVWVSKDGTDWTVSAEIERTLAARRHGPRLWGASSCTGSAAEDFDTGSTGEETDCAVVRGWDHLGHHPRARCLLGDGPTRFRRTRGFPEIVRVSR